MCVYLFAPSRGQPLCFSLFIQVIRHFVCFYYFSDPDSVSAYQEFFIFNFNHRSMSRLEGAVLSLYFMTDTCITHTKKCLHDIISRTRLKKRGRVLDRRNGGKRIVEWIASGFPQMEKYCWETANWVVLGEI